MPRGPKIATVTLDEDAGTISWAFGDGFDPIMLDTNKLNPDVQMWLRLHGVRQKVGDTWASAGGDTAAAYAGAKRVVDMLLAGDLRAARAGDRSEVIDVLCTLRKDLDPAEIANKINSLDADGYKAVRAIPELKAELAARAAKRAKDRAKKSGGASLAELFA